MSEFGLTSISLCCVFPPLVFTAPGCLFSPYYATGIVLRAVLNFLMSSSKQRSRSVVSF